MANNNQTSNVLSRAVSEMEALDLFAEDQHGLIGDQSHRGKKANRIPWQIFTDSNVNTRLNFWVNPLETTWRIGTRSYIEPTQNGAVNFDWRFSGLTTQGGPKFDQPIIDISFQSGWLYPIENSSGNMTRPDGINNFYLFLDILNRPLVFANGANNFVNIVYNSAIFPMMHLRGYFTPEGVTFSDSANDPGQVSHWRSSFIVYRSYPNLSKNSQTYGFWKAALQQLNFRVM